MSTTPDKAPHSTPASNEGAQWLKLEYEQVNQYGRTVYETIFRLAQMTFVINPALGVGMYYVLVERSSGLTPAELAMVGVAISILGMVYNLGAYGVYVQSHSVLESLLIRIREIDSRIDAKLHRSLEETAPLSYKRYYKELGQTDRDSADSLTRLFLRVLFVSWAMAFTYAIVISVYAAYGAALPGQQAVLLTAEILTFLVAVGALLILSRQASKARPPE